MLLGNDSFKERGIYWITRAISQGGYPDEDDCKLLRDAGVTCLFNLDLPYLDLKLFEQMGFTALIWKPIVDGRQVPEQTLLDCLDTLHQHVNVPGARLYIHCHAGINRSPTVLWLYLIACGMDPQAAFDQIRSSSPHAIPAHPALCSKKHLDLAQAHGAANYFTLKNTEILLTD